MGENIAVAAESFCDVVREHARTQGETIAFTYDGEETSFAALDEGANRAATHSISTRWSARRGSAR